MPSRRPPTGPVLALLFAGATFIAGYVLGSAAGSKVSRNTANNKGDASAIAESRAALGLPPAPEEAHTLSGIISDVTATGFTLDVNEQPYLGITASKRKVTVGTDTKLLILQQLSAEEFEARNKAFAEQVAKNSPKPGDTSLPPLPPKPLDLVEGKQSDLVIGAVVTVDSTENIKTVEAFTASSITVQPTPKAMPVPAPDETAKPADAQLQDPASTRASDVVPAAN